MKTIFIYFLTALLTLAQAPTDDPEWWSDGNMPVVIPGAPINNRGPANIGQAKFMARRALDALYYSHPLLANAIEADLVGPDKAINTLSVPFAPTDEWKNAQKAPLLIGELKAIAAPFYHHLHGAAPGWLATQRATNGTNIEGTHFPWSQASHPQNKSMATIGQLKAVFALRFESLNLDTILDDPQESIKPSDWQAPLLSILDTWQVEVRNRIGTPAQNVALSFYLWSNGMRQASLTPFLQANTGADGRYSFPISKLPTSYETGDRIEVRMSASPNQRVYLPWLPGNVPSSGSIAGGGSGLILPPVLSPSGATSPPVFDVNGGGGEGVQSSEPVYRFQDFLTVTYSNSYAGPPESGSYYPLRSEKKIVHSSANTFTSTIHSSHRLGNDSGFRYGIDAYNATVMGMASKGDTFYPCDYNKTLKVNFGDAGLVREVTRTLFVGVSTLFEPKAEGEQSYNYYKKSTAYPNIPPFLFSDNVICNMGLGNFPLVASEYPFSESDFYARTLVLGPVPMYVPRSVMGGQPFYYNNISKVTSNNQGAENGNENVEEDENYVRLFAELPFGCELPLSIDGGGLVANTNIRWTAEILGTNDLNVTLHGATQLQTNPISVTTVEPASDPTVEITFSKISDNGQLFTQDFQVKVSATAIVPDHINFANSTTTSTEYDLGFFVTDFEYVLDGGGSSLPSISKRAGSQLTELFGLSDDTPEGHTFNGGQRSKKVEPERQIGIDGRPSKDAATFVDAITGRFHHGETDFSLQIPGSDLVLSAIRSSVDTVWTEASGLRPSENPLLGYGPGWSTNLTPALLKTSSVDPSGNDVVIPAEGQSGTVRVRDYLGRSYTFLKYTNASNQTSYIADPTLEPTRENAQISLTEGANGNFTLTQPLLGIVHHYADAGLETNVPNNRHTPTTIVNDIQTNATGFTKYQYARLTNVTDRFGVSLIYEYSPSSSNLIPSRIYVDQRPELCLNILQNQGRIVAFWDPDGIKHGFTYESAASQSVLKSHTMGDKTVTSYGYHHLVESDPRPTAMLLSQTASPEPYRISTHHLTPNRIENGKGEGFTVNFQPSQVRQVWSRIAKTYYPAAGDPLLVSSITMPNQQQVLFNLDHLLKNGRPAVPAIPASGTQPAIPSIPAIPTTRNIVTNVTDIQGNHWTYHFDTPRLYVWDLAIAQANKLPTASSLFFPKLTRSCQEVPNSTVIFHFDPVAGGALARTTDAAGRSSSFTYEEEYPTSSIYNAPIAGPSGKLNSRWDFPTTATNVAGKTTRFEYDGSANPLRHKQPTKMIDHAERSVALIRDELGRATMLKYFNANEQLVSHSEMAYEDLAHPGLVTKTTRKAIATTEPSITDPAWVTDLIENFHYDSRGFPTEVGSDAANLKHSSHYSHGGRLLSTAAPDGGMQTYIYDNAGRVTQVTKSDGVVTSYQYDEAGRVVIIQDPLNYLSGREYDSLGRLVKTVQDQDGNLSYNPTIGLSGVDPTIDKVFLADYQDAQQKVQTTDPRGFISVAEFDAFGRLVKQITPANNQSPGSVPTDSADAVVSYVYDQLQSPTDPIKIINPLGYETILRYDNAYRLEQVLREYTGDDATEPSYSGVQYSYDPITGLKDRITLSRTPLSSDGTPHTGQAVESVTHFIQYDPLNRPHKVTLAEGSEKSLTSRTRYTSTGIPYLMEILDAPNSTEEEEVWIAARTSEYDALGRPVSIVIPAVSDASQQPPVVAHPKREVFYDSYGRVAQSKDAYGNATNYFYDITGRICYAKAPPVLDARVNQMRTPTTLFYYDQRGQMTKSVDPHGNAWSYRYDAFGMLTESKGPVVRPDGPVALRRPIWKTKYDLAGNPEISTDPLGNTSHFAYYPNNTLAASSRAVSLSVSSSPQGNALAPPVIATESFHRDLLGQVLRVIDANAQATEFSYDGLGRQRSICRDPDDLTRRKTEFFEYDALLPTAVTDAANIRKEFEYDDSFRMDTISVIGSPEEGLSFERDWKGRVTSIAPTIPPTDTSLGNPAISRTYDALGRLETETSNQVTSTYGYDLLGQVVTVHNNANDRHVRNQFAAPGRLSSTLVTSNGITTSTSFGYDLLGNKVKEIAGNGLVHSYELDALGRTLKQTLTNPATLVNLCETETQYDLLSNVTQIAEKFAPTLQIPDRVIQNTYNQRSQLMTEFQTESGAAYNLANRTRSELHSYDLAENRLSTHTTLHDPLNTASIDSASSRVFSYGNSNNGLNSNQLYQLTEVHNQAAPVISTFDYDANGSRKHKTTGALTDTYDYDSFKRLVRLELQTAGAQDNGIYQYRYDPLSRRITRTEGAQVTAQNTSQFAFSGNSPAHQWSGILSPTTALLDRIGHGVGGTLQQTASDGTSSFPRYNQRGDITEIFSQSGALNWHGSYGSNGILRAEYGTGRGEYGANGKYEEPGHLLNEGFRYRDKLTNTFITRDPLGFIDGPNDYNYVRHNSWSAWDPFGLATTLTSVNSSLDIGYVTPPSDSGPGFTVDPLIAGDNVVNSTNNITPNYRPLSDREQLVETWGAYNVIKNDHAQAYTDFVDAVHRARLYFTLQYISDHNGTSPSYEAEQAFFYEMAMLAEANGYISLADSMFRDRRASQEEQRDSIYDSAAIEVALSLAMMAFDGPLPFGDAAAGSRMLGSGRSALRSVSKLDGIPNTGIAKYDQLAVDSKYFDKFISGVKGRGFRISANPNLAERASLRMGRNKMVFEYNPKTFNVLDMRHEIQHFNQFKQYGRSMFDDINAMERGAYGFELNLGNRAGFSSDYMDWARGRFIDFGGN